LVFLNQTSSIQFHYFHCGDCFQKTVVLFTNVFGAKLLLSQMLYFI